MFDFKWVTIGGEWLFYTPSNLISSNELITNFNKKRFSGAIDCKHYGIYLKLQENKFLFTDNVIDLKLQKY